MSRLLGPPGHFVGAGRVHGLWRSDGGLESLLGERGYVRNEDVKAVIRILRGRGFWHRIEAFKTSLEWLGWIVQLCRD